MIYHLTGSKDTYITNKILKNTTRATTSNVGYASTIDLFKLYGESTLRNINGSCDYVDSAETEAECTGVWDDNLFEWSRALIKFDLSALKSELVSIAGGEGVLSDPNLKIRLVLYDVQGTQVSPSDFSLELYPVTQDFDEGIGDDVVGFSSLTQTNWENAKENTPWVTEGGDIGTYGVNNYIAIQEFTEGSENLDMDITLYTQSVWNEEIVDLGFIIKFPEALERDSKTYFVKRFASRHTRDPFLRPKLIASWSSYDIDDRLQFTAGSSNTIGLKNYVKDELTNLSEEPTVTLSYESWSTTVTSTKKTISNVEQTGFYEAVVPAIDIYGADSDLQEDLIASGSIEITEEWQIASTQTVYSGSIELLNPLSTGSSQQNDYRFSILDLKSQYTVHESPTVRLFIRKKNLANEPVRIPIELKSTMINKAYYQIKDLSSNKILIPFSDTDDGTDATRISSDSNGMYFSFPVSVLPRGKIYTIDIAFYDRGERRIIHTKNAFRVL